MTRTQTIIGILEQADPSAAILPEDVERAIAGLEEAEAIRIAQWAAKRWDPWRTRCIAKMFYAAASKAAAKKARTRGEQR